MKVRRGLAAFAGVSSAVAVGMAANSGTPAHAVAPPADGVYVFNGPGVPATWTIGVICDQVNGSRYYKDYDNPEIMADFCFVNVVSQTAHAPITNQDKVQNYTGRARLTGLQWTFQVRKDQGVTCPGGGTAESVETYAFDNETLSGTHTILHDAVCGLQPDMKKEPFSLQLVAPPPVPIERYPLRCNEIAICF
ncbi:hypothetical protein [Mycobacterium bourgelatii]|uniref:Secreted protein n=1 Tax=Mycobacterium bourgelatii TaxID=1273442 RepID=A0A7I9YWN8_MYCBU|nr:hypothetical protein [Mycobacterium bourgelatii]MCV6973278.1 hypothetical protein [Mycobacterium bourgelatii]GFG93055.1 hypothetical protein MBOU_50970 [Mycobacterium bourgelatii]